TGCCARRGRIRTSFASRAARGCPWSARARPKELIGRSRIPHRRDVRIAESWPSVRSNRWLVERLHRRVIQVRFPESWSSTFSGEKAVLTHRPGYFCLDNAFALIDGEKAVLTHRPGYFCLDNAFALIEGQPSVGKDPKGGPPRPAGQVSAQNPPRTWGTLLVPLVSYPLAS